MANIRAFQACDASSILAARTKLIIDDGATVRRLFVTMGFMSDFKHPALEAQRDKPLVYTAMSKHIFYFRMFISAFVLEKGSVPLNPFMVFDYFLLDVVDRDVIREGNNNLVKRCDEIWVFGAVSDGVLAEVQIAKEHGKPVRYFTVKGGHEIIESSKAKVEMESDVAEMRHLL